MNIPNKIISPTIIIDIYKPCIFISVKITVMDNSEEVELAVVNERNTNQYIPAIVIITAVIAVGLCLNVFASVYYASKAQKSVFQIFVMSLSINFVITNLVLTYDIVTLFYFVSFRNTVACKLFYVLKHWFVGNSIIFMVAVGFERYRSVCFPFSKPLSFRTAWSIIIGFTTLSFVVSVSHFATTDIIPVRITIEPNITIQGSTCNFSENLQTVRTVFHFVDVVLHSIITCVLVFFYTFIVRKLIITRRKVSSNKNEKNEKFTIRFGKQSNTSSSKYGDVIAVRSEEQSKGQSYSQSDENMKSSPGRNPAHTIPTVTNEITPSKTELHEKDDVEEVVINETEKEKKLNTISRKKQRSKRKFERRIAVMATVKTATTIACFLPYYVSMMVVSPNLDGDGLLLSVGNVIARRSYMLNSVVTPIIMMIFNDSFRGYVKGIFIMIFQKFKRVLKV